MKEKVVGILGGMGPEATVDLFSSIVKETSVNDENEHLRIIIDNNPKLPNRQNAILFGTESPVPAMVETGLNLKKAGADFIIIGANTAHYFYDEVSAQVGLPFLHIIDVTVKDIVAKNPNIKDVGVLATNAVMLTGLYEKSLNKYGLQIISLSEEMQEKVNDSILDYKHNGYSNKATQEMVDVAKYLIKSGAQVVVMGCTEIPLILKEEKFDVELINPNEIIAKAVVAYAKNKIEL